MNLNRPAPLRNVRKRLTVLASSVACFLSLCPVDAATRTLTINGSGWNPNIQGPVHSLAALPDGKLVIGGEFWEVNGNSRSYVARLNSSGALDESFATVQPEGPVYSVAVQGGNVLAGGRFGSVGGIGHDGIAKYDASGVIDHSFQAGVAGTIRCIAADAAGVTIGGDFNRVGADSQYYVAQFSSTGSATVGFQPGLQPNMAIEAGVTCLTRDASGKTIVAGIFNTPAGYSTLARLNADGSIDPGFQAEGAALYIFAVKYQLDGKLLVAGMKSPEGDGFVRRLNADGTIDSSFQEAAANAAVNDLILTASGKIVVGGQFTTIAGANKSRLARLNANGTLDPNFTAEVEGSPASVNSLALGANGVIFAGGWFSGINGTPVSNLARLQDDDHLTVQSTNLNRSAFKAQLKGLAGKNYQVESSSDFLNWSDFSLATAAADGLIEVLDDAASTVNSKFFRSRLVD